MAVEKVKKSFPRKINKVTIGTGENAVEIGGHNGLPFMYDEADDLGEPVIAMDIFDQEPDKWTDIYKDSIGRDVIEDPVSWAEKAEELGVDLLSLRLTRHAAEEDPASPEECAELATAVNDAVDLPLIIWGSGDEEPDNKMFPEVSQALAGEQCLIGSVTEDNYKTIAATAIADGHNIIGESPIDINICKQVNILLSDMGFPTDKIVIFTTNGALGYGIEYAYSIMERTRISSLGGDEMMAMPIIADIGPETQRAKEVKVSADDEPSWGSQEERTIAWETSTAVAYLQAGADILTMANPDAIEYIQSYIDQMTPGE
ncbi:acetyl-CoA decarbonylase/synthase complex subunit delta [Halarsenatibacter silvermanii]|uniref:Acetyl-CoA decarbonylase/synthase delta subunit n=1 Tax=Halarsenatibacter silvermanii TaxID=321763 RepID=A0A1G9H5K9_9FIRM|nr:acetyl-CoA decarbonylase/synthase complex subunit delta [Halarsenatibacter silvermanii]SDL08034.1 acetyl-CoA decarbonylase/synthase delta subunit [Halarsenatibacter silvermanii]